MCDLSLSYVLNKHLINADAAGEQVCVPVGVTVKVFHQ